MKNLIYLRKILHLTSLVALIVLPSFSANAMEPRDANRVRPRSPEQNEIGTSVKRGKTEGVFSNFDQGRTNQTEMGKKNDPTEDNRCQPTHPNGNMPEASSGRDQTKLHERFLPMQMTKIDYERQKGRSSDSDSDSEENNHSPVHSEEDMTDTGQLSDGEEELRLLLQKVRLGKRAEFQEELKGASPSKSASPAKSAFRLWKNGIGNFPAIQTL